MATPREYTEDEVRQKFLQYIWALIDYWDKLDKSKRDSLEGLAFSILSTLDGSALELPGFIVSPAPHAEDKDYLAGEGRNWFLPFDGDDPCDIGGSLHEFFHAARPE